MKRIILIGLIVGACYAQDAEIYTLTKEQTKDLVWKNNERKVAKEWLVSRETAYYKAVAKIQRDKNLTPGSLNSLKFNKEFTAFYIDKYNITSTGNTLTNWETLIVDPVDSYQNRVPVK